MRILVVDDNNDIVRLVRQVLELEHHTVVVARDGLEALQQAATQRPDAVVLDVNLPRMEGWEVCKRIKESDKTIPVMMLTVHAEKVDLERGKAVGANAYLPKPFDIPVFVKTMRQMLEESYGARYRPRVFAPEAQFINANGSQVWEALGRVATNDAASSTARVTLLPGSKQLPRRNRFNEIFIVVSGTCVVVVGGTRHQLQANTVLQIPPNVVYYEEVIGTESCVAWAICTPAYSVDLVEYIKESTP